MCLAHRLRRRTGGAGREDIAKTDIAKSSVIFTDICFRSRLCQHMSVIVWQSFRTFQNS
jgi:hypothetical protein